MPSIHTTHNTQTNVKHVVSLSFVLLTFFLPPSKVVIAVIVIVVTVAVVVLVVLVVLVVAVVVVVVVVVVVSVVVIIDVGRCFCFFLVHVVFQ